MGTFESSFLEVKALVIYQPPNNHGGWWCSAATTKKNMMISIRALILFFLLLPPPVPLLYWSNKLYVTYCLPGFPGICPSYCCPSSSCRST